jgi:regulator of protease activity HflC (stomatin/prohibitin superfamily)
MNIAGLVRTLALLAWFAVVGMIIYSASRASRGQDGGARTRLTLIGVVVLIAIALTTLGAGLVFIEPPERGVVISAISPLGYREEALQPGLRWVVPFVESVVPYPISKQTYTMSVAGSEGAIQGDDSVAARTSDGQQIFVDASVIFAIDPEKVIQVHIAWQDRYTNDLVRALARGIIRDTVSQFRVEEIVSTQRFQAAQQMRGEMARRLADNGLLLAEFVLRNITFSPEYAASVEQKQIAEQQAQQAAFVVQQRKQEAEQARQVAQGRADAAVIDAKGQAQARLIQAEAEAKALQMIADVLQQNQALLTYQYVNKLAPGIQVMLVPSNSPLILPLPTPTAPSAPGSTTAPTP